MEWVEVTRRGKNHALLLIDVAMEGFADDYVERALGFPFKWKHYRQFENARWLAKEDMDKCEELLSRKEAGEPGWLMGLANKFEKDLQEMRKEAEGLKISEESAGKMANTELFSAMDKWFEWEKTTVAYDYEYIVFANDYFTEKLTGIIAKRIPDTREQAKYFEKLCALEKPSEARMEKESILQIANEMGRGNHKTRSEGLKEKVRKHAEKFAHLGIYFYFNEPFTEEKIGERLKELEGKNAEEELEKMKMQDEESEKVGEILEELKLAESEKLVVRTMRKWAFAINFLDEAWNRYIYKLHLVFHEAARRLGLSFRELVEMRRGELEEAMKKGSMDEEVKSELKERMHDHAIILENGKIRVLTGEALKEYYKKELKQEESYHHLKEIRGQSACAGFAKGKVHLVLSVEEISKVKKGEILVASSTSPAYVTAMEKAAAIITNEGGLLCHAAIVSRELGVPCIVGTKIATKALKDGDEIEVDATKGTIRKI